MAFNLKIEIPPDQIEALRQKLNPKELQRALWTAANKVAAKTKTSIVKAFVDETGIARKYILKVISLKKTNSAQKPAIVSIKQKSLPLLALKASYSKRRGGVVVKLGSLSSQTFKHAWVGATEVGHAGLKYRAVFESFGPKIAMKKGRYAGAMTKAKKGKLSVPILRRQIHELFAPSILTQWYSEPGLEQREYEKAMEEFPRILASQVEYVISKRTPPDDTGDLDG